MTEPITPPAGDPSATPPTTPAVPVPAAPPTAPAPPADDKPLGPGGEKALQAEREARKALEKQIADLAPLKKLADALGAGAPAGKSEVELLQEKFAQHEVELTKERAARWRAEVAAEKSLTPAQAARLVGTTREELLADADALVALFPAQAAAGAPRTPAPDPSQGPRGPVDIDALIRDAETKGNVREAIRLKNQKLHTK